MAEDYPFIDSDVICRSLKSKTFSKQIFDQPSYNPNTLMAINLPSLPNFWLPSSSWFEFTLSINYTSNNLDATTGGAGTNSGTLSVAQMFPHSSIIRANVVSSNGQSIANIMQYAQVHLLKVLECGMDSNVTRMNLMNVNANWQPYTANYQARCLPYTAGIYIANGNGLNQNIVPTGTGTCLLTTNTQFGMLPIFQLDALLDLSSMASQTRSSLRLELLIDLQANFIASSVTGTQTGGGTGSGVPTLVINSVTIAPVYYMCLLQPTIQLQNAAARLINENSFLVPIQSYLTNTAVNNANNKYVTCRAFADEESVSSLYVVHQLANNSPVNFNSQWDMNNLFSHCHVTGFQITSGGSYFPSYSPMQRQDAYQASGDAINNFDAIQFFRHLQNTKSDKGDTTGSMITPLFYNSTIATPTFSGGSLTIGNSCDFYIAYSFETGCSGAFSGYDCRANGGVMDANINYNGGATVPSCNIYVFTEYMRAYALTTGGLLYFSKSQYQAKVNTMSAAALNLLNKLLHLSGH